ncbi:MAG: hypothetical protein H7251_15555 [Acetobacteraceae bacterium]|nr:hypothetical protein [Acetobacteraceae bacterium]
MPRGKRCGKVPKASPTGRTFTDDPDLHLLADGTRVEPRVMSAGRWCFDIPPGTCRLWLMSRAARPAEIGLNDDPRLLGLCVYAIEVQTITAIITLKPDSPALCEGFHLTEQSDGISLRWTDGKAELPGFLCADDNGAVLVIIGEALPRYHRLPLEQTSMLGDAFENLGSNCDFGLFQRHLGHSGVVSLLRWANINYRDLINGLEHRFEGLGDSSETSLIDDNDYRLQTRYFRLHTFTPVGQGGERAEILRTGCATLRLLRRKLLHDISTARRIFVFRSPDPDFDHAAMRLMAHALSAIGPAGLLCVGLRGASEATDRVTCLQPGLYAGYLSRFVAADGPFDEWRDVCTQTLALAKLDAGMERWKSA